MYIITSDGRQIVNSDFVERFCIAEKDDADLIVASYGDERKPVTLGRYSKREKEAQMVFQAMSAALASGDSLYDMPESILYAMEKRIMDARIKRKGGS